MHNMLFAISVLCLVILLLIFLLKRLQQPYLIAYVVAGILLGPHVSGVFSDSSSTAALGEIGILLLMFFLGMEIDIPDNRTQLRKPVIAQGVKMLLGAAFAILVGQWLHWSINYIILLSVILAFNSTAVVSEFLRNNNELSSPIGKAVLNVLLLQDIIIAPVFASFQFMNGTSVNASRFAGAAIACALIILLLRTVRNRNLFQLRLLAELKQDHELQVFAGGFTCLGFALLASVVGLTPAIGSFAAGIYIGRTNAFHWLETALRPFKIFFVSLFFVSIGVMLDLNYILEHYKTILVVTAIVLLINSFVAAAVFRLLQFPLRQSIYAGALLSQTGEFGLLACSLAFQMKIIDQDFFKSALAIAGLSLALGTIWMSLVRRMIYRRHHYFKARIAS